MANQTADRNCGPLISSHQSLTVAAGERFFNGSLVANDASGYAARPSATTDRILGVCWEAVDNTNGLDGAERVKFRRGIFPFASGTSADALTQADIGNDVYAIDDQTVGKTSGTSTRAIVGELIMIEDSKFYVRVGGAPVA